MINTLHVTVALLIAAILIGAVTTRSCIEVSEPTAEVYLGSTDD